MKFISIKKQLFLWLFLCGICSEIQAWQKYADPNCNDCDLGCFNIQVQAGIAPVIWSKRGNFTEVSCNAGLGCPTSTVGPVVPLFEMPKFSRLYKLPWTVGGLIGYQLSDCDEVFIEGNYRQANAKKNFTVAPSIALALFTVQPQFVFNALSKYKFYDFYVGARHYFDLCCATFFLGGQIGLVHHKGVDFTFTVSSLTNTCAPAYTTSSLPFFGKNTRVAGGANIGFDYCICDCFDLVFTAEFIATCGPCGNQSIPFSGCTADTVLPELRPNAFLVGSIGNEFFFPITVGLNFAF